MATDAEVGTEVAGDLEPGGVSYHANMGKGAGANAAPPLPPRPEEDGESELSKQEKLIKCDLLGIKLEDFVKGRLDMYHPPLPADAAELARLEHMIAGRPRWLAASTHQGWIDGVRR